ncbi:MAG: ABC transporter ATP-binding protein [Chloroflexi bacterium]|nr:MAG: ABC transporter ATP-binding protein [Chloroflexota bacterium]
MLHFHDVDAWYGQIQVLHEVGYVVYPGEIVALLGSNGAGKTTTMKAIMGIVRPRSGTIDFAGRRLDTMSTPSIVKAGVAPVPEGRRIFGRLTVEDNLTMGAYVRRDQKTVTGDQERVYDLFPRLKERRTQVAGTMSGGEQQMLAIGRALMSSPKLLIMDEPSMGLSPIFVERVFDTIQTINKQGTTIFMVEQNAFIALSIADRGYVLRSGRIVLEGPALELRESDQVRREYLGES